MIYLVVKRFSEKYKISAMCSFYKVSRSGYYSRLRRPELTSKDSGLLKMIEECQAKHKQRYPAFLSEAFGVERIAYGQSVL